MILSEAEEVSMCDGFYYIYMIKNICNNKIYIGSSSNVRSRFRNHLNSLKSNKHHSKHLQSAYNKYGPNNFIFKILEVCSNKEDMIRQEQIWMEIYKSYDAQYGYNICKIAYCNVGHKFSEEVRKKMSIINSGVNNPFYGKKHSEESKRKISQSRYGKKASEQTIKKMKIRFGGQNNPRFNVVLTQNTKDKISKSNREAARRKNKLFKCIQTDEVFLSISDAAEKLNISKHGIYDCLKGKCKITNKIYTFEYLQ